MWLYLVDVDFMIPYSTFSNPTHPSYSSLDHLRQKAYSRRLSGPLIHRRAQRDALYLRERKQPPQLWTDLPRRPHPAGDHLS